MIKEITKFFNEKPIFGIILVILLLFTVYYISQPNTASEHMDQVTQPILPKCTISDDQQFNAQFVKQSRILNFKCTIKGIDYYLACVKMSDYIANNPNKTPDCSQSMLILIPATEIQTMLNDPVNGYLAQMKLAEDVCNSTLNLTCKATAQTDSAKSECSDTFSDCVLPRFFLHDFNVVDVTPSNADVSTTLRKYVIKGTAIPALNGQSSATMFNTFLINEHGINMVCGDTYSYGAPNIPKQYAEVIIIEKTASNTGGVVNADPMMTVKIRFNALQQIISTDQNGVTKRTPIVDTCTGEQKVRATYLGVCNSTQTCTRGANSYQRVCVYDDIMDSNVLDFQPFVVNA